MLGDVCQAVVESMGSVYPDISRALPSIQSLLSHYYNSPKHLLSDFMMQRSVLTNEETVFLRNLQKGEATMQSSFQHLKGCSWQSINILEFIRVL